MLTTDFAILLLRLSVVVLLYLFVVVVVLTLWRDLRRRAATQPHPAKGGAHLLVLEPGPTGLRLGQMLALQARTSLGRDAANTIALDDPAVSSRHALLIHRDGRWWVRDLQSTNGTLVNHRPITDEVPLEPGDVIELGRVRLKLAS